MANNLPTNAGQSMVPGQSAIGGQSIGSAITQALHGQTAPKPTPPATTTPKTTTPTTITPPATTTTPAATPSTTTPPVSLGTLTDSEQRVWNTLVGDIGATAAAAAVINSRALAAGVAAISSNQAKTVTVTPSGGVTTVTTTPGVTNTGQATATSTGVNTSVPVPKVTPPAPGDNYYQWGSNQVTVAQYNSWTPAQQFTYLQSIGQLKGASLVVNNDGTWGYTSPNASNASNTPTVLDKYTNSDGTVNLSAALAGGVTASWLVQNGFQQSDIQKAQAYNIVNSVLKPNNNGTYNANDIAAAISSGKLTQAQVDLVFEKQTPVQITVDPNIAKTIAILNKSYGTTDTTNFGVIRQAEGISYDIQKALTDKAVTPQQLIAVGFDPTVVANAETVSSIMAILNNPKNGLGSTNGQFTTAQLQDALNKGLVTKDDLVLVGFDRSMVTNTLIWGPSGITTQPPSAQVSTVKATKTGIDLSIVNTEGKAVLSDIVNFAKSLSPTKAIDNLKNAAEDVKSAITGELSQMSFSSAIDNLKNAVKDVVSYADSHSGITPTSSVAETFTQEGTALKKAAEDVATVIQTFADSHSGIKETPEQLSQKETFAQEGTALKSAAESIGKSIEAYAKAFNATHSGLAKIETVNGQPTITRIAPAVGLGIVSGEGLGEQLTAEGTIEAGSGGLLTPEVLLAALATLGIAAGVETVKVIREYQASHKGVAPTAAQVTLTDSAGNITTLADVVPSLSQGVKLPTVLPGGTPFVNEIPATLPGGTPFAETPSKESMPVVNEPTPQEGMTIIENPIPSIETFPLGVQAPPQGAVNEKPSKPVEPPKTEAGKQIQAEVQGQQSTLGGVISEESAEAMKQEVKALPNADLTPKTEEGKKIEATYKEQQYAKLMELRTIAAEIANLDSIIRHSTTLPESELPTTDEGKALQTEVAGQAYAELNSLKDTAEEIARLDSIYRHSTTLPEKEYPQTEAGKAMQAKILEQVYEELTKIRKIAAELANAESIYRHSITLPEKEYPATEDGKLMQAQDLAKKTEAIRQIDALRAAATELEKFQELIQEIAHSEAVVDFKTMADNIDKIRENEIKTYKQDIDKADGGSWLIHGDDGSLLFSVIADENPAFDTPAQRAATLEQLEQMWKAGQITKEQYDTQHRHWSEGEYEGTAASVAAQIANVKSDVGVNRLVNSAAVTGKNIEELDAKVAAAYIAGELTDAQLADYTAARAALIQSSVSTASSASPTISPETSSAPLKTIAATAGLIAAIQAIQQQVTQVQIIQAIQDAIQPYTGIQQTQPLVVQIAQTAQQIMTQEAMKAGLQVATQEAIQTQERAQEREQTQEQTEERAQEREQARERAVENEVAQTRPTTAETEAEATKPQELTDEAELETALPLVATNGGDQELSDLQKAFSGGTAWKQGIVYWVGKPPYRTIKDWHAFRKNRLPPKVQVVDGGPRSAYKSIQAMGYDVPENLKLRLGFQRITIDEPNTIPGKVGAIGFKNVLGQPVTADVKLQYRSSTHSLSENEEMSAFLWGTVPARSKKAKKHKQHKSPQPEIRQVKW